MTIDGIGDKFGQGTPGIDKTQGADGVKGVGQDKDFERIMDGTHDIGATRLEPSELQVADVRQMVGDLNPAQADYRERAADRFVDRVLSDSFGPEILSNTELSLTIKNQLLADPVLMSRFQNMLDSLRQE
jgi:hypothetical protein